MADVNRGNRPLSPHLTVYRPQMNSVTSILSRIAAVGLSITAVVVVWWFLGASTGREAFAAADGFATSWFGDLMMFVSLWAIWYHMCAGIRHLYWDTGKGFDLSKVEQSSYIVIGASVFLTIATLVAAN